MSFSFTSFLFLKLPFRALRVLAQVLVLSFGLFVFAPIFAGAQDAPQGEDVPGEPASPGALVPDGAAAEDAEPEDIQQAEPEDIQQAEPEDVGPDGVEAAEPEGGGLETESATWDVSTPCENVLHPYEADLCQQWRTAEAAQTTAEASERTVGLARLLMLIGMLATLLLLAMFVPLLMAAFAARRAARGSALAPSSHGAQDHGTKENELRAYVDVDSLEFIETPESEGLVKVRVTLRNSGQTPAFKLQSVAEVGIRDISDEDLLPTMPLPEPSSFDPARPRLGRDATATEIVRCESPPKLADRVTNGDATILVWGLAEYRDVFDRRRKTTFQYLCNAETLDTGQVFKPMVRGDEDG